MSHSSVEVLAKPLGASGRPLWAAWPRALLRVALRPGQVCALLVHRRLGREVASNPLTAAASLPVPAHADDWREAAEILQTVLREAASTQAQAALQVTLSDHFVRYTVIPWIQGLHTEGDRRALARQHVSKIYGARAEAWTLRVSPGAFGQSFIAAAVETALIDTLSASARAHGFQSVSIQPSFAFSFNRLRAKLAGSDFWFAAGEAGRLTLGRVCQQRWSRIVSVRVGEDWQAALPAVLARERLRGEFQSEVEKVYVHAETGSGELMVGELRADGLCLETSTNTVNDDAAAPGAESRPAELPT